MAKRAGYRIHSQRFSPWADEQHLEVLRRGGWSFNDKKYQLWQLAHLVSSLDGHTAECGAYEGRGSYLILDVLNGRDREHHIFDSFEGVSQPIELDRHESEDVVQWSKNDMSVPIEVVRQRLQRFPNVRYHEGWIPDRFDDVADHRFSFVHIDVDLYEPTRDSIEFFFPRLERGGVLLCDDYAAVGTPGARRAMDEYFEEQPESIACTLAGSGFVVKQSDGVCV